MGKSRQSTWKMWTVKVMAEGRCKNCGKPIGEDGTKRKCRPCANKWNDYQKYGSMAEREELARALGKGKFDRRCIRDHRNDLFEEKHRMDFGEEE